jgi:lysozyme
MQEHEGLRLESYLCPAKVWTIGWGNTRYEDGSPVKRGQRITAQRAEDLFNFWVDDFARKTTSDIDPVLLNRNQFSAIVSFAYNVGLGNFRKSTLRKILIRNPDDPEISTQFKRWNKGGGKVLNGLIKRRQEESDLYFTPVV